MSPGTPAPVQHPPTRGRLLLLSLMLLVVVLGLGSRSALAAVYLPDFLRAYAGDTLWASLVYLCLVFLRPRLPVRHAAAWALGISVLVELSQFLHTPWLDALRAHRLGALVLGRGFVGSDLVCYAAGVALAAGLDLASPGVKTHPGLLKGPIPGERSGPLLVPRPTSEQVPAAGCYVEDRGPVSDSAKP